MIPKYKAWDKEEKEWLSIRTIGFYDDGSLWYLQAWDDNENDIDPPYIEDDLGVKWELSQSTKLKDKNGTEIFEGDIVVFNDESDDKYIVCTFLSCFGIRFSDVGFVAFSAMFDGSVSTEDAFTIIGNIFEHPNLLGE